MDFNIQEGFTKFRKYDFLEDASELIKLWECNMDFEQS